MKSTRSTEGNRYHWILKVFISVLSSTRAKTKICEASLWMSPPKGKGLSLGLHGGRHILFLAIVLIGCLYWHNNGVYAQEDTAAEKTSDKSSEGEDNQNLQRDAKEKAAETTSPENELSGFEAYIRGKSDGTIKTNIGQFGYNLFQQSKSTFAPVDAFPVGPDHLLGPDDEILITLWGKVNARFSGVVDREGKITIKQIGVIQLAGLTFAEAKAVVEKEFARLYKPEEVKMNVSMGKLRAIRVYVVGKVRQPGSFYVSSFSTLLNAVFAAGGPSKVGSMRDIQLKRKGKTIAHFDLYDFLLKGDKTGDVRIMPEDVIFIPTVGPMAGIAGNVKSPAIYELKGKTKLLELIEMAGGLTAMAFKGRVQLERIMDHKARTVVEEKLEDIVKDSPENLLLQDGDLVKIFQVTDSRRTVSITGAVSRSGEYGIKPGKTRLKDVLLMTGGLLYFAADEAELTRITITKDGPVTTRQMIDLALAMEGDETHNILLKENDYFQIRTIPEWSLNQTVRIAGEVKNPGTYMIKKGERLFSLIERAGGYTDHAYLSGAVFTRESVKAIQQLQLNESIDKLERQLLTQSAKTLGRAISSESIQQEAVSIEQRRALISKMRSARALGRISIQLEPRDDFRDSPSNLVLEGKDMLMIPKRPHQVQVTGSVYNSTAFIYDPKATVASYISLAGGMTDDANKKGLYILKVDGTTVAYKGSGRFIRRRWDAGAHRWTGGSFMRLRLDPGDNIVIPMKIEKVTWLREVRDFTQILYQIAITAGVIIVAF